jgi:copper oxidase (laccase) domain-containing protein
MIKQTIFNDEVLIGISEVSDGNMRFFGGDETEIIKNQKRLSAEINAKKIARLKVVYNRDSYTNYLEINEENVEEFSIEKSENDIPTYDGLVTREPDIAFLLPLADCLGAVIYDPEKKIFGLLHAGRQNIEQEGPKSFIEFIKKQYGSNPKNIKIYYSPYALDYRINKLENKTISNAATEQLLASGILKENIIDSKTNTLNDERFPSHSSGDTSYRFAIVAKMNI